MSGMSEASDKEGHVLCLLHTRPSLPEGFPLVLVSEVAERGEVEVGNRFCCKGSGDASWYLL